MAAVRARLAGLTREQLEEFAVQAAAELPCASKAISWLNATLAVMSPVPAWAVTNVLVHEDLCAAIVSHLDLCDYAAASVCRRWLREWRAILVRRRVLSRITEMPFKCDGKPARILKLPDYLCVSDGHRLMKYDEDGATQIFSVPVSNSWLSEIAGADDCVFCFDYRSLKLRRLRHCPSNGMLLEDATVTVRTLTDDEEDEGSQCFEVCRTLQLCAGVLYLIRPPLVEAFEATTLAPLSQHGFFLDRDHLLPLEAFDGSQLLSYIAVDRELLATNRNGQLVKLVAPDVPFPLNPFAVDVCDDRLYVLDAWYDEESEDDDLVLWALTLEGRPTQPPLKVPKMNYYDVVIGNFSLSASPEGIYIADYNNQHVRKVDFAGQEGISRVCDGTE